MLETIDVLRTRLRTVGCAAFVLFGWLGCDVPASADQQEQEQEHPREQPRSAQEASQARLQAASGCPTFQGGVSQGRVSSKSLDEVSGLVASQKNPDVLWVHNDSGDAARLYALKTDATLLGVFELPTLRAHDWEDIAIGPGSDSKQPHLYIGDIGDNARHRTGGVLLHRVPEPTVSSDEKPSDGGRLGRRLARRLGPVETFHLRYPDRPHDAETLLVDPKSGEVVILTKALLQRPRVFYATSLKQRVVTLQGGESLDLKAAEIPALIPTGGDVSPDGRWVIVRSYGTAYLWQRDPAQPLHRAFAKEACAIPLEKEPQGEAIGFAADGRGYFTLSEGRDQPLFFYAAGGASK